MAIEGALRKTYAHILKHNAHRALCARHYCRAQIGDMICVVRARAARVRQCGGRVYYRLCVYARVCLFPSLSSGREGVYPFKETAHLNDFLTHRGALACTTHSQSSHSRDQGNRNRLALPARTVVERSTNIYTHARHSNRHRTCKQNAHRTAHNTKFNERVLVAVMVVVVVCERTRALAHRGWLHFIYRARARSRAPHQCKCLRFPFIPASVRAHSRP